MRLGKRQSNGVYFVEFDNKKRVSLKTRNADEAKRLFNRYRKEWLAGKLSRISGECSKTLEEFRKEYVEWAEAIQPRSTFRSNRLALDKLIHYAGKSCKLDKVGIKHIDQMKADLKKLSPNSINNYIRHARVVMNKAKEWGYVQVNPLSAVKQVKSERHPPAFLDRKQASEFIASIKDIDLRRLVVAYLTTGRRRSELLNLEWKDVCEDGSRYLLRVSKTNSGQWFPGNSMFRAVLNSIGRGTGRVFKRWEHPDTLSHKIKEALKESGFGHLRLHDLRHSFASIKIMEGYSLKQVGELLGHTSMTATQIYSHLSDDHLAEISEMNLGPVDLGD